MKYMLRFLCLLLMVSVLAALLPSAAGATPSTVAVMSYNLKNTNYSFLTVSSMVTDNGADIVCMQEVNSLQYAGMNAAMKLAGYDCTLGKSSGSDGITESDEHLPIYFKTSKYREYSWGTYWLSDTPTVKSKFSDSSYYRIVTWACYEIIGTEDYILVFNTHLDFGVDLLIRQLNVILSGMVAQSEVFFKAKNHVILAGDLNCANTSIVCKYIQGDVLYNDTPNLYTAQKLDEARQIAVTTTPNSNGNYFTQPSSGPTMDLDHIYVSHRGFHCDSYSVISNAAGSDHLPILAKLRFKTDHNYSYHWASEGKHRVSCSHCSYSAEEPCSFVGDSCSLCGGSSKAQTFNLVKSLSEVTTGRYLMIHKGFGAYPGSASYYASTVYGDSGFHAMQCQEMGFSSLPDSLIIEPEQIPSMVWYFSGDPKGITIGDARGNTLHHKGNELYLNKNAATVWVPEYSTSAGHFAIRENNTHFLSLRTDLNTIGKTDTPAPMFGCLDSTSAGNYKIFLYRDVSYCAHAGLRTQVFAPTCTQQGYTVYSCSDCSYVSTTDFVAAIGHSYSSQVTAPTEESQGYTTHTCAYCGDSYRDSYTDPIYTITFVVPPGMEAPAPMKNSQPIILPDVSGSPYLAYEGSTFLGWVTKPYDHVSSTEVTPYIFKAGATVNIYANVPVYALFSYHEGEGQVEKTFTLHDGSRSIKIGDQVLITASDHDYAMSSVQGSSNRSGVKISKNTDTNTIVLTTEQVGIFTVGWGVSGNAQKGQISLKDEAGYLCISDPTANTLTSSPTLDAYSTWAMSRNSTTHAVGLSSQGASSNHILRYQSSTNVFAGFNSGAESTIRLYYLSSTYDPTLYYTTGFSLENCAHPVTSIQNASNPSCEAEGYTGDTVCSYCEMVVTSGNSIPATGHSLSYTKNADGTHLCTCSRCGARELQNCNFENGSCVCGAIPAAPVSDPNLTFTNHSLSLASSIRVNFILNNSYLVYDSYRIVIEKDLYDIMGSVIGVQSYEYTSFEVYNPSYSKVALENISATEMTASLRATIYGYKNGVEYVGNTDEYTVQTYALKQLRSETATQKLKTLCADLLNYGSAAQEYKEYNLSSLPVFGMTDEMQSYASSPNSLSLQNRKTQSNAPSAAVTFIGNALQMQDKVEIMFIFSGAKDVRIDVSYQNSSGKTVTRSYTEQDMQVYGQGLGYYSITVDSLNADEMFIPVTAALYYNNVWQSTCTYSIESYCAKRVGNEDPLGRCCTMMMLYGASASAYFR